MMTYPVKVDSSQKEAYDDMYTSYALICVCICI